MLDFDFNFKIGTQPDFFRAHGKLTLGERVAIVGPSGCGKTTFLKVVANLIPKTNGHAKWSGREIDSEFLKDGQLGFCFQTNPLFFHLTVEQNIMLPLQTLRPFKSYSNELRRKLTLEILARANLSPLATRYPHSLSGGEMKRISLLRALITKAPLLLLDEPTSGLDTASRQMYRQWFQEMIEEFSGLIIFVSHHEEDLRDFATSVTFWPRNERELCLGR